MIKVKQLYVVFDDGDGHKYLIPKCEYRHFEKALERIYDSFDEHNNDEIYYEELNDLLDAFAAQRLEGEEVFVVLPNDLVEGEED